VEDDSTRRVNGEDGASRMDATEYGDSVVAKVLAGSSPKLWTGASAWVTKLAASWLPMSWMVILVACSINFKRAR
ncbi:hypothetical protein B0J11DRAFT_448595, partial [Dendryphion nanum]